MTQIANLITHESFAAYVAQAMLDRSVLIKSGIASTDPVIAARCNAAGEGGHFVNLPFFNQLDTGKTAANVDEVLTEGTALTPDGITASADVAVICRRGKAFGATDLAAAVSGADPMSAIANQLADYKNKARELRLIATIRGVFGTALASHVAGTTSTTLDADLLLDGAGKLGDRKAELTAYVMNSATETWLQKLEGTDLFKPSDLPMNLKTYNGRAVIVDDNLNDGEVYLFGAGAVAMNDCPITNPYESYREELKSQGGIIYRDASILHVRGCNWKGAYSASGTATSTMLADPTNTQLELAGNWGMVYPSKAIRVAKVIGKLAA